MSCKSAPRRRQRFVFLNLVQTVGARQVGRIYFFENKFGQGLWGVPKKPEQENNKRGRVSVGGGNTERKRWKKHGGEVGTRTIGLPAHSVQAWCVRRLRWIANERPWKTSRCRLVRGCLNWRHSPLNPMEWVCRVAKTILAP